MDPAAAATWLHHYTLHAPPVLRERVLQHIAQVSSAGTVADVLARASRFALNLVAAHPEGGRSIALDLLAADALITLALLAQSQVSPAGLETFASDLLPVPVESL